MADEQERKYTFEAGSPFYKFGFREVSYRTDDAGGWLSDYSFGNGNHFVIASAPASGVDWGVGVHGTDDDGGMGSGWGFSKNNSNSSEGKGFKYRAFNDDNQVTNEFTIPDDWWN
jgi:hypothetical protein